ncbi:MAG: carbohydrate deacetylase [Candidatus Methylomirabilales bacterium]
MARRAIVNADDFNLTQSVSRGILDGHRRGILTSTTVMVNLPGLERNAALLEGLPGLSVGLHVNLTLGTPVLAAERVRSLVDGTGCFFRDRERLGRAGEPEDIREEVRAQARRFKQVLGRAPSHIDSHYHMHRHPAVFAAVLDLAASLRVPLRALDGEMAARIQARGLPCPDRAEGDVGTEPYWTVPRLSECLRSLPEGTTEIVAHPGYWEPALDISSYSRQREAELQALCDPAVRAAAAEAGVTLISYLEL